MLFFRMLVDLLEGTSHSVVAALMAGESKELNRQAVVDLSNTMRTRQLPLVGAPGVKGKVNRKLGMMRGFVSHHPQFIEIPPYC